MLKFVGGVVKMDQVVVVCELGYGSDGAKLILHEFNPQRPLVQDQYILITAWQCRVAWMWAVDGGL